MSYPLDSLKYITEPVQAVKREGYAVQIFMDEKVEDADPVPLDWAATGTGLRMEIYGSDIVSPRTKLLTIAGIVSENNSLLMVLFITPAQLAALPETAYIEQIWRENANGSEKLIVSRSLSLF